MCLKICFIFEGKLEQAVTAGKVELFGDLEAVVVDGLMAEEQFVGDLLLVLDSAISRRIFRSDSVSFSSPGVFPANAFRCSFRAMIFPVRAGLI